MVPCCGHLHSEPECTYCQALCARCVDAPSPIFVLSSRKSSYVCSNRLKWIKAKVDWHKSQDNFSRVNAAWKSGYLRARAAPLFWDPPVLPFDKWLSILFGKCDPGMPSQIAAIIASTKTQQQRFVRATNFVARFMKSDPQRKGLLDGALLRPPAL